MRNVLTVMLLFFPWSAEAYIGPGLGLGTIGVVLGVLVSIFLALFAILWYPFKRLFKKMKGGKPDRGSSTDDSTQP